MKYLRSRLSERSSRVALGAAVAAGAGALTGAVDVNELVAALVPLVAVFLTPEKAAS
jgi:hypothetical protein